MGTPSWLPVVISCVSFVIALSAFIWQIQRARFKQSVDLLFRLEGDFFDTEKKVQRARAASDLLEGRFLEAEPILDFFETMALLLRRGALDPELVKHTFFYWIDNYYEASRQIIEAAIFQPADLEGSDQLRTKPSGDACETDWQAGISHTDSRPFTTF